MMRICLIGLVLVTAGCASGDDTGDTTTTAPPTTKAAPTTTTTTTTTTAAPAATTTAAPDVATVRADVIDLIIGGLKRGTGVFERVDLVNFDGAGTLKIEGHVRWASQDRQPEASCESIGFLATIFGPMPLAPKELQPWLEEKPTALFGGEPMIHIVTVSANGDHRYESLTDWETLMAVDARQLDCDGWASASGAGF